MGRPALAGAFCAERLEHLPRRRRRRLGGQGVAGGRGRGRGRPGSCRGTGGGCHRLYWRALPALRRGVGQRAQAVERRLARRPARRPAHRFPPRVMRLAGRHGVTRWTLGRMDGARRLGAAGRVQGNTSQHAKRRNAHAWTGEGEGARHGTRTAQHAPNRTFFRGIAERARPLPCSGPCSW